MFVTKIIIYTTTYRSITGNTKKIAEAIFNEIQVEKEIEGIEEVTSLEGYDLSFLGFPMEWFGPSEKVKQFLENYHSDS